MFEYPAAEYNYADFIMRREIPLFEKFRERMHVGDKASDFELLRLDDGKRVTLSSYWKDAPLLIEFGSFT